MPPKQCPNCGRFLKNVLVEALEDGPQPCPGCAEPLTPDLLGRDSGTVADGAGHRAGSGDGGASVRPPDLDPGDVRDDASDVLEGWDRGADAAEIATWNEDHAPLPVDAIVVGGSGLVGALLGAVLLRRRVRGALVGGLFGVLAAAVARRIWRLPD